MCISRWLVAAACMLALPVAAAAQQTTTTVSPDPYPFPIESHWLASGSLGSDFESDAEDPGVNFAGTFGWLWRGVIGGEFQANFSPDVQLDPAFTPTFLADEPAINSYMLNVMAAAPLMAGGQFQPYVSAGAGWFTMSADPTLGDENIDLDQTETGWNAGVGVMGFLGQLGVRADLRYFAVGGDEFQGVDGSVLRSRWGAVVDDQEQLINANLLSGLSFWRGNLGVALRW
ncbi:MAG: outer membrane beta-barrel protein [Acidobacteria bacterium]|nr:outer membrane beta-barrel protein [Acidobacteriota bacterium]